jgi:hypothetical protein
MTKAELQPATDKLYNNLRCKAKKKSTMLEQPLEQYITLLIRLSRRMTIDYTNQIIEKTKAL